MIEGIIAGFKFFFLVSGLLLWTGFLVFLIIYVMENEGIRND
jgi:hypothetical protein